MQGVSLIMIELADQSAAYRISAGERCAEAFDLPAPQITGGEGLFLLPGFPRVFLGGVVSDCPRGAGARRRRWSEGNPRAPRPGGRCVRFGRCGGLGWFSVLLRSTPSRRWRVGSSPRRCSRRSRGGRRGSRRAAFERAVGRLSLARRGW